jgi:synaptobrevin homolog YKT6
MPIFYIQLFNVTSDNPVPISFAYDFSSLPLLARYSTSTTEMFAFLAKTFISNTKVGYRQGCIEDDYYGWAYIDSDRLGGVVMTDIEYDRRVSFSLLDRVMREYKESERNWDWTTIKDPIIDIDDDIKQLVLLYQNPERVDSILKINRELDNTTTVLYKSIDKMLERGEKIDTLVLKSDELSNQSKMFYKKSKRLNSWCGSCIIV